jgi:hypothetical protein
MHRPVTLLWKCNNFVLSIVTVALTLLSQGDLTYVTLCIDRDISITVDLDIPICIDQDISICINRNISDIAIYIDQYIDYYRSRYIYKSIEIYL